MNIDKKMRTIKFRAWDKKEKKMFDVCDLYLQTTNRYGVSFISGETFNAEDIELMQYTGLHDKNGKEIYEGDIVRGNFYYNGVVEFNIGFIEWADKLGRWWVSDKNNDMFSEFNTSDGIEEETIINDELTECLIDKCEVIGNIYENSKLIN